MDSITDLKTLPSISILIPDCDDWSTLKVIRCLGEVSKIRIHILSKEKSMLSRFSRFCGHYHYHKSVNDSDWMETIKKLVQQWNIDLILPTTLKGMIFVSQNRESLSKLAAIVPLARPEMFAVTNNKWALYEFMNQSDLPGLPTVYVGRSGEVLDVSDDNTIEFPALLKPVSESGGYGIVRVTNHSDLERAWHEKRIINGQEYILQSYIPAVDYSLSVCCKDGEIVAYTSNRAIVPSKRTFGLGRYFEYINNEQIIDIGRRLVSALEWNGVADIDFLVDSRDQKIYVLEFNPRFWQSLLGGLIAGVNFPLIWCLSALDISFSCNQHETTRYLNLSLYIKELLSRLFKRAQIKDIHWYQTNLKFISTDPLPEVIEVMRRLNKKIRRKFALHPKHKKAFN